MRSNQIMDIVENRSPRKQLLRAVRSMGAKSHALAQFGRQHKWIWAILVTLVSIRIYFVRALLSALLLFTIFYVILASLVGLYVLVVYLLSCSIVWTGSMSRSFLSFRHNFRTLAVRVPDLVSHLIEGSRNPGA